MVKWDLCQGRLLMNFACISIKYLGMPLLDHRLCICSASDKELPETVITIYTPMNRELVFWFLHIFTFEILFRLHCNYFSGLYCGVTLWF